MHKTQCCMIAACMHTVSVTAGLPGAVAPNNVASSVHSPNGVGLGVAAVGVVIRLVAFDVEGLSAKTMTVLILVHDTDSAW